MGNNGKLVIATLVVLATTALTPQAIAATPSVDPVSGGFPVSAVGFFNGASFSFAGGVKVTCLNSTAGGQTTNGTTGEWSYTFGGCKASGLACTSTGQASGTIKLETTTTHFVYLDENHTKPGVLLTPPASGILAQFKCAGVNVEVNGNGFLVEITSPECGQTSKSTAATAQTVAAGTQKYLQVEETGTTFDLTATIAGGAPETAAMSGAITATAERELTFTCPEQK